MSSNRRTFLQRVALATAATQAEAQQAASTRPPAALPDIAYPRVFTGPHLKMLAFPLGGVGAGSISLGGRGQLARLGNLQPSRQGQLRPTTRSPRSGRRPATRKPVARVLESRIQPPYEGSSGSARRTRPACSGWRPPPSRASFRWRASISPIRRCLSECRSKRSRPFIPHEPDESGLPVAILRYRVTNPAPAPAKVSIAWSIDNPTGAHAGRGHARQRLPQTAAGSPGCTCTSPTWPPTTRCRAASRSPSLDAGGAQRHLSARLAARTAGGTRPCSIWDDFSRRWRTRARRRPARNAWERSA